MVQRNSLLAALPTLLAGHYVQAQQFADSDAIMAINWPGMTTACGTALNTTISCPLFLHDASLR